MPSSHWPAPRMMDDIISRTKLRVPARSCHLPSFRHLPRITQPGPGQSRPARSLPLPVCLQCRIQHRLGQHRGTGRGGHTGRTIHCTIVASSPSLKRSTNPADDIIYFVISLTLHNAASIAFIIITPCRPPSLVGTLIHPQQPSQYYSLSAFSSCFIRYITFAHVFLSPRT